jgi:hypothetical protein
MALPRPVVEPPPTATAQSAPSWRATSRASRAVSIGTCITARSKIPAALSPSICAMRSADARCSGVDSTSARRAPSASISLPSCEREPGPNTTRPGWPL